MAHDHASLTTASTYLNNLLLARGLLRTSTPLDFVKPSREARAGIINLVHDLVIQHDKDADAREHIAATLAQLRSEETRHGKEVEKLAREREERERILVQARAGERAAREEVRRVERAGRGLAEQVGRLKGWLAQVRAQGVNDLRRRDGELARLRAHLQGGQRGAKGGAVAPSLTVSGGGRKGGRDVGVEREVEDPGYELRQETTEFLTQLSQSLSDENDGLIGLIRGALGSLRELLGPGARHVLPDSRVGSMGSGGEEGKAEDGMLQTLPTSYETLAADMEGTLEQLKGILTNPNFVSMEEVEVREEEIVRLREGWEHMEKRWKDLLLMMESWRRKMSTGDTINIDDLRQGMGLMSPQQQLRKRQSLPAAHEEEEEEEEDRSMLSISNPEQPSELQASAMSTDDPRPASKDSNTSSPKRKRDLWEPPEFFDLRPSSRKSGAPPSPELPPPSPDLDDELDSNEEEPAAPTMTVAQKLDLARAEAEAKAAAPSPAKRGKRKSEGVEGPVNGGAAAHGVDGANDSTEGDDTLGSMRPASAVKKTKIKGRPRRRKSTLSPEELEALMGAEEEGEGV